jgi:hypothetical protein
LIKMVQKIAKKMGKGDANEGLVEAVWVSMKQGSGEEVAWDAIEHEVVTRWVFGEVKVGGTGSSRRVGGHGRGVGGGGVLSTLAVVGLVGLVWGTASIGAVLAPVDRNALDVAVGICLRETATANGSCPIFAASNGVMGDWDVSAVTTMDYCKCTCSLPLSVTTALSFVVCC